MGNGTKNDLYYDAIVFQADCMGILCIMLAHEDEAKEK